MLILPAEAAHASRRRSLQDWHFDGFACNFAVAEFRLLRGDVDQSLIVNSFDEAVSKSVQHGSQSADVFGGRQMFLRLGTNGTVINKRAACNHVLAVVDENGRVDEISVYIEVAGTNLGNLAGTAGDRALMAISANGGVVDGTESTIVSFPGFEIRLVKSKRIIGWLGNAVADTL